MMETTTTAEAPIDRTETTTTAETPVETFELLRSGRVGQLVCGAYVMVCRAWLA
jgi:hypothetical protein